MVISRCRVWCIFCCTSRYSIGAELRALCWRAVLSRGCLQWMPLGAYDIRWWSLFDPNLLPPNQFFRFRNKILLLGTKSRKYIEWSSNWYPNWFFLSIFEYFLKFTKLFPFKLKNFCQSQQAMSILERAVMFCWPPFFTQEHTYIYFYFLLDQYVFCR